MRIRMRRSALAVVPLVLMLGCSDGGPLHPHDEAEVVPLQLSANLSGTPIQTLVVEVTAADILTPLAYNLHVNNGQASGSIQIPPGSARTITVRAFETDGTVTHEGSATVNVSRGNNPPVQIPMIPRSGHQPIDVTLAEVSITVNPSSLGLATGETARLSATVVAAGGPVTAVVGWATLNPAVATVDNDGLVTGVSGGSAVIVATYAGVGAAITVQVLTGQETDWYADADGDGYGDPASSITITIPPAGYVANPDDCDDSDPATNPSGTEIPDGNDNDCDGIVDEGFVPTTWYLDADEDTYGDPAASIFAVGAPLGYVDRAGDCDDSDGTVNPSAGETFGDGIDNDCDGVIDGGGIGPTWYADADADGFGDASSPIAALEAPPGYVADASDCNDGDPTVNPSATELVGDGIDNDCDGSVDEGDGLTWYADADADGYGDPSNTLVAPAAPPGFVADGSDCNDADPSVNPGAAEVVGDGVDNDCDGAADEGAGVATWFVDADGDGFGHPVRIQIAPSAPPGYVNNPTDCNDAHPFISPARPEVLDGLDNNCDGPVDNFGSLWFADFDNDHWGDPTSQIFTASPPVGFLSVAGDCNGANPGVYTGAPELPNGIDDDCDSVIDDL